ncbi:3D domain-containing protein [Peptoniphilus indolicus]|uniref:3D/G5 domain protein n=2 Tax=Peptoniphilus indolicus TaxID=33030 RepID=G4D1H8_9FIRM|nr:3D domain-containing protein [Peptoniphilus indolicus]EGY80627.1 3D/G5 domain protein [Peptoniphilus indolicus ATCC 29427]SUB74950.1 Cell wall-binding protein yocH precursor [Peptoniphilus indolicus]
MSLNHGEWKKKALTFVMGAIILSSTFTLGFNTIMSKEVSLIIDGKESKVVTYTSTVGSFLENEGIELKDKEVVEPSLDTKLVDNMDIIIKAPKNYKLQDGAESKSVKAIGDNVGEILKNLKISVDADDVVTPAMNTPVKPETLIIIERVNRETFDVQTDIPFETEVRENSEMFKGEEKVIQQGVVGKKTDTVQHTFVNGQMVSIDIINSVVSQEPVNAIVEKGTKDKPKEDQSASLQGRNVKKVIVMQATAYDPTAGSKTAMGTRARVGAVAVDPRVIPLGSKLYIESMDGFPTYGYAVAEDTGGAIKGNRIDLFYSTNAQANKFGRRNVKVYVLD